MTFLLSAFLYYSAYDKKSNSEKNKNTIFLIG